VQALLNKYNSEHNDFISNWVSLIKTENNHVHDADEYA